MNIFETIREDHDRQRSMLDQLVSTEGASDERKKLFNEIKEELSEHADAEERHFYKPLIDSDMTQDKARHGIAEHHEIDELVEKLQETDMSSPGWLTYAKQLQEQVVHHLDEEEHEVFQMAGKVLTEAQKNSLGDEFQKERGRSYGS